MHARVRAWEIFVSRGICGGQSHKFLQQRQWPEGIAVSAEVKIYISVRLHFAFHKTCVSKICMVRRDTARRERAEFTPSVSPNAHFTRAASKRSLLKIGRYKRISSKNADARFANSKVIHDENYLINPVAIFGVKISTILVVFELHINIVGD